MCNTPYTIDPLAKNSRYMKLLRFSREEGAEVHNGSSRAQTSPNLLCNHLIPLYIIDIEFLILAFISLLLLLDPP